VLLTDLHVPAAELARRTGWRIEPRGACKGDRCVPLPDGVGAGDLVDVAAFAAAVDLPLVEVPGHDRWALGPEHGRALTTAEAPELVLEGHDGTEFALSSLQGRKTILTAWASW
jgi:hypothetical protein